MSAYAAIDYKTLATAAVAGSATWAVFNRRPLRGDYAVVFFSLAYLALLVLAYVSFGTLHQSFIFSTATTAVYALSALFVTAAYRLSPFHPLAAYPGPKLWWISSLKLTQVSWQGRRHLILDELHRKYGPFLRIGPDTLSINHMSANYIYSAQARMEKSDSYRTPGGVQKVALFFKQAHEKIHAERKRIWSGAFTGEAVAQFFPPLERRTWQLLDCIEARQQSGHTGTVDLSKCFCHWSYDFVGDMIFGGSNNLELMKNGDPEGLVDGGKLATIVVDSIGQTPWLMDLIWYLPAGRSVVLLSERAAELMRTRIKADADVTLRDLASYLLAGNEIPHSDLELDALVAVQGGSDNTGTTMSLAFYFMLAQPKYYALLQAELDAAFPDRLGHLHNDKLAKLPFLNAVINEALRLGSPFFLPRVVPADGAVIEGEYLPEGTTVALAAYSQQVSPDNFWPAPLDFLPERWLPDSADHGFRTDRNALFSFTSGPHVCIAKAFAYQEMRLVMARVALAFDMALPKGFDVPAYRAGILNMRTSVLKKPLTVAVSRRAGLESASFAA